MLIYNIFEKLKTDYNLQGRVKFPTGGKAREPKGRSGETPEPTVKVWMGED